jgi:uncharacterized membrane protein YfcA
MEIEKQIENVSSGSGGNLRAWLYPAMLAIVYVFWFGYMIFADRWALFAEYWPVSLTMTLGSFVAGATAEGGAAIAFPVFTKLLQIPSSDARTFGLMIQAVGMTMAGVMIYAQRVRTLPQVITWVSFGGIFGQIAGTYLFTIPAPYPRILFTFVASAFGVAMFISRWVVKWEPRPSLPTWNTRYRLLFFLVGVFGGSFAAQTGSGIDMLTFIVLTLAFGINEKISTPTTVIIMGLNSIVGFFLHGVISQDIGIAWSYWLVAVPIVVLGAPLGAYVAARVNRDGIIKFLLFLITLELVTTLWLVPFRSVTQVVVTAVAVASFAIFFVIMLEYRRRVVALK